MGNEAEFDWGVRPQAGPGGSVRRTRIREEVKIPALIVRGLGSRSRFST